MPKHTSDLDLNLHASPHDEEAGEPRSTFELHNQRPTKLYLPVERESSPPRPFLDIIDDGNYEDEDDAEDSLEADPQKLVDHLTRTDFRFFVRRVFETLNPETPYIDTWHLDYLCWTLMQTMPAPLNPTPDKRIKRLIVNIAPRSMKSIICTVALPAFIIGHFPHERIICASYSGSLAKKFSVDVNKVMKSEWYQRVFPRTQIEKDTEAKITTPEGGFRIATSMDGTVTGEGGSYIIADDIMKPEEARSPVLCEAANRILTQTLFTRVDLDSRATKILAMQRLSSTDPTAFLLEMNAQLPDSEKWQVVALPAKNLDSEPKEFSFYGRTKIWRPGELLNPGHLTEKDLETKRIELGTAALMAQYYQQPQPPGGGLVKLEWLLKYKPEELPAPSRIVQSWDTAITNSKTNDPSVCTTWYATNTGFFLVDVKRAWMEYHELKAEVVKQAAKWKPHAVLIENKSSGQTLLQDLKLTTTLPLISINIPSGQDKVVRMAAETPLMEAGKVWIPQSAPWLAEYEMELAAFPGKRDDQVDSTSQALKWLRENSTFRARIRTV